MANTAPRPLTPEQVAEPLRQEILWTSAHTFYLLHRLEGGQIIAAVLRDKAATFGYTTTRLA